MLWRKTSGTMLLLAGFTVALAIALIGVNFALIRLSHITSQSEGMVLSAKMLFAVAGTYCAFALGILALKPTLFLCAVLLHMADKSRVRHKRASTAAKQRVAKHVVVNPTQE